MWAKLVIACTSVIMLPWSNFYLCINYVLLMHNALMELHFFSKTKLVKVFLKFYLMITIYLIFVFRKLGKAFSKHHANICKHPWLECYRLPMDWMVLLHLHASLFRWTFFSLSLFCRDCISHFFKSLRQAVVSAEAWQDQVCAVGENMVMFKLDKIRFPLAHINIWMKNIFYLQVKIYCMYLNCMLFHLKHFWMKNIFTCRERHPFLTIYTVLSWPTLTW